MSCVREPLIYEFVDRNTYVGPFVIFDRDGTLTRDSGYTHRVSDFEWMPGAVETLASLQDAGFGIFIATNQSGIGRGYYSLQQMENFHRELVSRAQEEAGATLWAIAVCPHAPSETEPCGCRKPQPGLIRELIRYFRLDSARGWMVGDSSVDLQAGASAGMRSVWLGRTHPGLDSPGFLEALLAGRP